MRQGQDNLRLSRAGKLRRVRAAAALFLASVGGCRGGEASEAGAGGPKLAPAEVTAFEGERIRWAAPGGGRGRGRMVSARDGSRPYRFRAVWDLRRPPEMVVLIATPGDLFGAAYQVQAFARSGERLRGGIVTCGEGETPYCLVEVRSDAAVLPGPYRGRWILAVALLHDAEPFDPALPVRLAVASDNSRERGNLLEVQPVRWGDDDEALFNIGTGILAEAADAGTVEVRHAERAMVRVPLVVEGD